MIAMIHGMIDRMVLLIVLIPCMEYKEINQGQFLDKIKSIWDFFAKFWDKGRKHTGNKGYA